MSVFGCVVKANNNGLRSFENLKGVQPCEYNQIFEMSLPRNSVPFDFPSKCLVEWLAFGNYIFFGYSGISPKKKFRTVCPRFKFNWKLRNFCSNGKHSGNLLTGTVMNNWHSYWPVVVFGQNLSKLVKIRTLHCISNQYLIARVSAPITNFRSRLKFI